MIPNKITGQDIRFLQTTKDTGGKLLEMESTYLRATPPPPLHYHPRQHEDFLVLQGQLSVQLEGQLLVLGAGDKISIAAGQRHSMWNGISEKTVVRWQVRPALQTEYLMETMAGLANDGKTDGRGAPSILQVATTLYKFSNCFRLAKPGFLLQKMVFGGLLPIARLFGYKATYAKYID